MLTITTKPGCELLLVPVKKNAWDFIVWTGGTLAYWDNGFTRKSVLLPPGSWEFVATTDTIKEEQAAGLVACYIDNFYEDYTKKDTWESFSNAIESLKSAITAAGGDKDTVYAILKKQ
jgi:hypothetical protein